MATINDKNVGDIVLIDDIGKNGAEYIVIHKGRPSTIYDSSTDGVWLLRKNALPKMAFDSSNKDNDYTKSELYTYLNTTFSAVGKISEMAKTVRIPYVNGTSGTGTATIETGEGKGLQTQFFLLAGYELNLSTRDNSNLPILGSTLDYFSTGNNRACSDDSGGNTDWWLRDPCQNGVNTEFYIAPSTSNGGIGMSAVIVKRGLRPAFIAYKDLKVNAGNYLQPLNSPPSITSNKSGDLGTLTSGFTCNYSVNDVDAGDSVTVTLKLDNSVIQTFTGVLGRQETYTLGGTDWLKLLNGTHNFKICASDGKETSETAATFTRNCTELTISLSPPLNTSRLMKAFNLRIQGYIPSDADVKYEVCNNAKDSSPAWEDCTARVKSGLTYVFKNKTAQNGCAVNFRITAKRGTSNSAGFIEKIICGYE